MASRNHSGGSLGEWLPIIILFAIPTLVTKVIAFFLLVSKLVGWRGRQTGKRHPYDVQREQQNWEQVSRDNAAPDSRAKAEPGSAKAAAGGGKASGGKGKKQARQVKTHREEASGGGRIVLGAILTGIFSLGTAGVLTDMLQNLFYSGIFFSEDLIGALACVMFLGGCIALMASGISKNRRTERYANYLAYIGANREVSLAHMAATFDVPVRKLCKDLRRMLAKGVLPTGYLDLAEGKLFLTEMGYRAPEPKKEPEEDPDRLTQEENAILREIRQVNDDIPDEVMSEKIDRIEEITGKILAYQKTHPNREGQLRSFLNYYLPTTLKILRAYAQLDAQGIEGENISAAKARIEGMMDQVVAGFERQLDKLFQDDALDVTSDVEVLENMLRKDGLSDDEGMTLGM